MEENFLLLKKVFLLFFKLEIFCLSLLQPYQIFRILSLQFLAQGREHMKTQLIEIVPYNPNWPKMFEKEAELIKHVLGKHCLEIHHIGSTAVPQLIAKPKLDILAIVDKLGNGLVLQDFGYKFKGELNIPLRYYFSKPGDGIQPKINLHLVEKDHGFIQLNLHFRDYLRNNTTALLAYSTLKEELLRNPSSHAKQESNFTGYNLGKDNFIKTILKQSGFNGLSVNFCLHKNEWSEYHRILEEQIFKPIQIAYDRTPPIFSDKSHYHFVMYKGTTIVSVAQIELLNATEAALRHLETNEAHKKLGYATHLLKILENWAKQQAYKVIKLHANTKTENYYRALGYIDMASKGQWLDSDPISLGKLLE